jgi:hypothetical protein
VQFQFLVKNNIGVEHYSGGVSIEPVTSIQYELKSIVIELYRVIGSDSSRRNNSDTADDSNCVIVNCKSECAINLLRSNTV